ncbi:MAG: T9SS type A sorting domain-containing protein, partial [Calditrichota bacterium]
VWNGSCLLLQDEQGNPGESPPVLSATLGSEVLSFQDQDHALGAAGVARVEENYRALTLAFPIEMISGAEGTETREDFAARIWRWLFGVQAAPHTPEPPVGFFLLENVYPNPFNSDAIVNFTLDRPSDISLGLWDISGRKLLDVIHDQRPGGRHSIVLNTSEWNLAAGIYFLQLQAGGRGQGIKVVYLK